MDSKQEHENTVSSAEVTDDGAANLTAEDKSRLPAAAKAWILLVAHGAACIAVALAIALAVNGYEALDPSYPRVSDGRLILRVSDVTTLISVALVIVKLLTGSWSTLALWGCGHYLLYTARPKQTSSDVSFMMRWKLPPWIKHPSTTLETRRSWVISMGVLFILLQTFIGPILTGAVNWKTSSVAGRQILQISSVNPTADFGEWYWYTYPVASQRISTQKATLREAAGLASLTWADSTTVSPNGTSLTGNGCRHIVNNDNLAINSTLANAIIPCISFHGITWYTNSSQPDRTQKIYVEDADALSLVDDSPSTYYEPGVTTIFDPNLFYNTSQSSSVPPASFLYTTTPSNIKTVSLMVYRQTPTTDPACTGLTGTPLRRRKQVQRLPSRLGRCD